MVEIELLGACVDVKADSWEDLDADVRECKF